MLAIFGEIGAGEQAERRADADTDDGHDDRADDSVAQAAFGRSGRRRVGVKYLEAQPDKAVIEQREQDQREPGDAEQGGAETERADDDVGAAAASVDRIDGHVTSPPSF